MTYIVNDQYFTKESVAKQCWSWLDELLDGVDIDKYDFLEPSVGQGVFVKTSPIPLDRWHLYELDETLPSLYKGQTIYGDFLESKPIKEPVIAVGNPPFGRRSRLAVDFINHIAEYADLIAFVLPIQFSKYLTQNRLNKELDLLFFEPIENDAFESVRGRDINHLRTGFYVFGKGEFKDIGPDLRIRTRPPTTHPDFKLYQYNRTKEAEKYFDYDWDFAVLRQGYGDYTHFYTEPESMDKKKQYMFLKAKDEQVLANLQAMDFEALSKKNTATPGFGKADLVDAYTTQFRR